MVSGVKIMETITQKCFVEQEGRNRFRIILTQGLNRQIRRMCEALDYKVVKLKRTRIMNINLNGLNYGQWRYLNDDEVKAINDLVATSSKTEEASVLKEIVD